MFALVIIVNCICWVAEHAGSIFTYQSEWPSQRDNCNPKFSLSVSVSPAALVGTQLYPVQHAQKAQKAELQLGTTLKQEDLYNGRWH